MRYPMRVRPPLVLPIALVALVLAAASGTIASAAPKTTRMNVDTVPTGAEAYLVLPAGEEPLGLTPLKNVKLPRGMTTLRFAKGGYQDLVVTREVKRKESLVFNMQRKILPAVLEFYGGEAVRDAEVIVDGVPTGRRVPCAVEVPPGRHQASVRKEGFQPWERTTGDLTEGQKVTFEVVLVPSAKARGSILVTTMPAGASVTLNGARHGASPTVIDDLEPGNYVVGLALEDFATEQRSVVVSEGERVVLTVDLARSGGRIRVLSDVPQTAVTIDGTPMGETPLEEIKVAAGTHVVVGSAAGYDDVTLEVEVQAGETKLVQLGLGSMRRLMRAALRVTSNAPGSQVSIGGSAPVPAPYVAEDLRPGTYQVTVTAPDYAAQTQQVVLEAGTSVDLPVELLRSATIDARVRKGEAAQVFIDGAFEGTTPLVKEVGAGTYTVVLERPGAQKETHEVALAPGERAVIVAKFGRAKSAQHRAMPASAQPIDINHGTIDIFIGWPQVLGVRFNTGIGPDLDLGLSLSSTVFTLTNEVEARVKWLAIRNRTLALGLEAGLGGGGGVAGRSTFFGRLTALGSLLIAEKVAITMRIGGFVGGESIGHHWDSTLSKAVSDAFHGAAGFQLGLGVEFRVSKYLNIFIDTCGEVATTYKVGAGRWVGYRQLLDYGLVMPATTGQGKGKYKVTGDPILPIGGRIGTSILF